jgi:hypothetical protein
MGSKERERYFVFMDYDPEYERIRNDRSVIMTLLVRKC